MKKGIVYYTHNECQEYILNACRDQIDRCLNGMPLVSVSLQPLDWHENIVLQLKPCDLTMFEQQLAGLEAIDADVVFFCEHDVLYHPSHFDFDPPRDDIYYFNINVWAVDADTGQGIHYDGMRMTSGLVAYRDIHIEHYTNKVKWVAERGKMSRRKIGYEPGKPVSRKRLGDYGRRHYRSEYPNVDIKHDFNITRKRFDLSDFNNRKHIEDSWVSDYEVPYWGSIKDYLNDY